MSNRISKDFAAANAMKRSGGEGQGHIEQLMDDDVSGPQFQTNCGKDVFSNNLVHSVDDSIARDRFEALREIFLELQSYDGKNGSKTASLFSSVALEGFDIFEPRDRGVIKERLGLDEQSITNSLNLMGDVIRNQFASEWGDIAKILFRTHG